jgi:hypothetical protein
MVERHPGAYLCNMNFHQGQQVRTRDKKLVGKVEKKLTSLDDVYVVLFEEASRREEKLVRGADLEAVAEVEKHKTA